MRVCRHMRAELGDWPACSRKTHTHTPAPAVLWLMGPSVSQEASSVSRFTLSTVGRAVSTKLPHPGMDLKCSAFILPVFLEQLH